MKSPLFTAFDIFVLSLFLIGDKFFPDYYFFIRGVMIVFASYLFITAPYKSNWRLIRIYVAPVFFLFILGFLHLLWMNLEDSILSKRSQSHSV